MFQPHRFPLIYFTPPIGPPSYCETVLHTRVNKLKETLSVLYDMKDSQLPSCLALPKLSYTLRTCPPSHISNATDEFDSVIRSSLEAILGGPIPLWSWQKASLPSNRGGLNLRSASLHAPAAFISSASTSQSLVDLTTRQACQHT